jgi:hypothetical protein
LALTDPEFAAVSLLLCLAALSQQIQSTASKNKATLIFAQRVPHRNTDHLATALLRDHDVYLAATTILES